MDKFPRAGKLFRMTASKRTISTEDYLERIHELTLEQGDARAVDLAEVLGIRPP